MIDTKALREKVLDLAIRGKLVPQDPSDEPASVLLERIRAEKEQMVKEGKLKPKDIKNDTIIFKADDNLHYEQFKDGTVECIEDKFPFEIPNGWEWVNLGTVCDVFGRIGFRGYTKGDFVSKGEGAISLSPSNIVNNSMDYDKCSYITWQKYEESPEIMIYNGDILLVKTGSSYGKSAIVYDLPEKATINPQFVVLKNSRIITSYLCYFLQSSYCISMYEKFVGGTAIPTFSQANLKAMYVAIPPLKEQSRIVNAIKIAEEQIVLIDDNSNDLQTDTNLLKTKILDLAIRGKLVPQNPDDEPASVLLDRIRAEKEELIKQGKIKRDKKESVIFKGEDNSYYIQTGEQVEDITAWELDGLPENWDICILGEICDYGSCTKVETDQISDDEWILDLEDIEKNSGKVLCKTRKLERNAVSTKHKFSKGQVLYSKLRPYLNKVVLAEEDGYCTSEILPLKFLDTITPQYARYYLMSPTFLKYADRCSYGVKMPRLSTTDGKKAVFTIPPINEQLRIVTAIETAFIQLDEILNIIA